MQRLEKRFQKVVKSGDPCRMKRKNLLLDKVVELKKEYEKAMISYDEVAENNNIEDDGNENLMYLTVAAIALKGVGGLLFMLDSTLAPYLLLLNL